MILFVCLIFCSPEYHPHSSSAQLASLPVLSAFFMGQSVRFFSCVQISHLLCDWTSLWMHRFSAQSVRYVSNQSRWNSVVRKTDQACLRVNFHPTSLRGFRKVTRGIELFLQNQKGHVSQGREHSGSWGESGLEGHWSTPPPVTYVDCNSIKRPLKLQIFFRLQRSHALISAKWCHVSCSSGLFHPCAGFLRPPHQPVR